MANEDFDMQPVTSGNLAEVGFNPNTKQIRISFQKSGAMYEYDNCTQEEFDALVNPSTSANDAFTGLIKGVKPYRKL